MGSRVTVKDQLKAGYEFKRAVLLKLDQRSPGFATKNFDKTDIEAVLSELDRLYDLTNAK